jgi:hypothetical protein
MSCTNRGPAPPPHCPPGEHDLESYEGGMTRCKRCKAIFNVSQTIYWDDESDAKVTLENGRTAPETE